jgi:Xaa-Pro aminopeptidase
MLTSDGCLARRQRLWQQLPEEIAWVLIGDSRHVQYFSGFRINPLSFSADQRSLLLLMRDGRATLLADNFARRSCLAQVHVNNEIIVPWYTHRKSVINRDDALRQALDETAVLRGDSPGLIEPEGVTEMIAASVADYAAWQFQFEDAEPSTLGTLIRSLRRFKHDDEVAVLRRCTHAGDAGQRRAMEVIRAGMSELDLFLEVQRAAQEAAGVACVVYGDFRATHAKMPKAGGLPTQYQLQHGDLFILDFSVVIDGYRSDFTNTLAVGPPSAAANSQFEACRDALAAGAALLRPGLSCRELWTVVSQVLESRGFGKLAHHAGHGLGLEHPEPPVIVAESTDALQTGDVVTLEPGCYVEGTGGIRLEHNYLITDSGCDQLSGHQLALRPADE